MWLPPPAPLCPAPPPRRLLLPRPRPCCRRGPCVSPTSRPSPTRSNQQSITLLRVATLSLPHQRLPAALHSLPVNLPALDTFVPHLLADACPRVLIVYPPLVPPPPGSVIARAAVVQPTVTPRQNQKKTPKPKRAVQEPKRPTVHKPRVLCPAWSNLSAAKSQYESAASKSQGPKETAHCPPSRASKKPPSRSANHKSVLTAALYS
jgi:hypothetical protein